MLRAATITDKISALYSFRQYIASLEHEWAMVLGNSGFSFSYWFYLLVDGRGKRSP